MRKLLICPLLILSCLFSKNSVLLEDKAIIIDSDGLAIIGNGITIEDAKVFAVNDAKRNALEQAGTYLESNTEALNYVITKDEIRTFTASVLKADILNTENALLDGSFALKVKIRAVIDTDLLNRRITEARNDSQLRKQLENERKRVEELTRQVAELLKSKNPAKDEGRIISDRLKASDLFAKGQRESDPDSMIRIFSEVLGLDPSYAEAYLWRGYAYTLKKDYGRTFSDYGKAIELQPSEGNNYRHRGYAYQDTGEKLRAADDFIKAAELGHLKASMYTDAAYIYLEQKNYEKALELYTKAISADPSKAAGYRNRGAAYFEMKDYKRTADDVNEYLRLDEGRSGDAGRFRDFLRSIGYEPLY